MKVLTTIQSIVKKTLSNISGWLGLRQVKVETAQPKAKATLKTTPLPHNPPPPLLKRSAESPKKPYTQSLYVHTEALLQDEVKKRALNQTTHLDSLLNSNATPISDDQLADTLGIIGFQDLSTQTLPNGGNPRMIITKNLDDLRTLYALPATERFNYITQNHLLHTFLSIPHSLNLFRFILSSVPKDNWASLITQKDSIGRTPLHKASYLKSGIPEGFIIALIDVLLEQPETKKELEKLIGYPLKDANDPAQFLQNLVTNGHEGVLNHLKTTLPIDDMTWNTLMCQRTHDDFEYSLTEMAFFNNQWDLGFKLFENLPISEKDRIFNHTFDNQSTLWHHMAQTTTSAESMKALNAFIQNFKQITPERVWKQYFFEKENRSKKTPFELTFSSNHSGLRQAMINDIDESELQAILDQRPNQKIR